MRRLGRWILALTKWAVILLLICGVMSVFAAAGTYIYFSRDLPKISSLEDYQPSVVTTFYSEDDRKIAEFYKQRRIVVKLSEMPKHLIQAFVATEDARFYEHEGIDLYSIMRAFFKNLEAGTIVQGGSTITQQVAKSFFLTPERSYTRKLKEAILAYRIDRHFTKDEILFLYLNQIYLGHGAYGVEAAAQNYFAKSAEELTIGESAMLAGLPRAPSWYSPHRHFERARQRQIYVLNRMVSENFITNSEASEAMNTNVTIEKRPNWFQETVPYYTEHVRRIVKEQYGEKLLYTGGLRVYTAVDIEMQEQARKSVEKGLRDLDKRQGYRGPVRHISRKEIEAFSRKLQEDIEDQALHEDLIVQGVVVDVDDKKNKTTVRIGKNVGVIPLEKMRWARKPDPEVAPGVIRVQRPGQVLRVGDVIRVRLESWDGKNQQWNLSLEQTPRAQAALICMESDNAHVRAMVGGRKFSESQFNRATQSRRQPGSAFKPVVYAAALDKGYTPATVIADTSIVFTDDERDFTWKPDNYDNTFHGFTLLRDGLIHSRNVVTVKIMQDIGVDYVIDYARKLGIESQLDRNLSTALGSSGVSLLELVRAYGVFANQGIRQELVFIRRIEDRNGNVIYEAPEEKESVIDKSTAYIITHLLEKVVTEGTGWRIKALKRPVAGKTGTTNNLYDAWFMGYTPRFVTGVWVGHDQEKSLGKNETGSRAASPIWLDYMQQILEGRTERVFPVPDNVVFAKIDAKTGLLPNEDSEKVIDMCFKEGTVPERRTKTEDEIADTDDFFKKGIQ
ncbi:penicillin-binding protein 1A [Desulfosalsimonas propionicica]|uniref:Penicillin-binding protein 1A n=1 Tax=Desulfosalsimonas propionicica TaxID=332175 RepID=A0A7W0C6D9_9BACT|nr:PBP1A family penicillin-binding protein [Desulfosalsimonas propionicica]MBA2879967.1 penicillin-binding protein 1A [Desulfosalsimonas propionicica]